MGALQRSPLVLDASDLAGIEEQLIFFDDRHACTHLPPTRRCPPHVRPRASEGDRQMTRLIRPTLALLLALQCGCGVFHKPSWNKPWGKGTWIPALVCGAVGAG